MIHNDVKNAVESGDISSLKYFFCDCLDGDPTFAEYEEDYEYCKSKGVFFVPHTELHPMSCGAVDESYWVQLKKDFMQNPSVERMEHMREVAKILYSSRIRKIEEDKARKAAQKAESKKTQPISTQTTPPPAQPVSKPETQATIPANPQKPADTARPTGDSIRRASEPITPDSGIRRASEPVRPIDDGIRRVSEPVRRVPTSQGTQPKKSNGVGRIAVAVLAVVIVAIVVICLINK